MARGPGALGISWYLDSIYSPACSPRVEGRTIDLSHTGPSYSEINASATVTYNNKTYYFNRWSLPSSAIAVGLKSKPGYQISEIYSETDGSSSVAIAYYLSKKPSQIQYYKVSVATNIPNYATVSGGEEYQAGTQCTIATSINTGYEKQYRFLYWKPSTGNNISTKSYTFTVTENISLMAVYEEIKRTKLILYDPNTNPEKILYSQTNGMILRDE